MNQIKPASLITKISNAAPTPVQMFQNIIDKLCLNTFIMNLATVDSEFGVLNRSVMFRGFTESYPQNICFVTERDSRKYKSLKENNKISLTIIFPEPEETWQIRLFDAKAVELDEEILKKLWQQEPLFAKIRSHICESGKPNDGETIEQEYQKIMEKYEKEGKEPEQTKSYTAFKVIPNIWDFYRSERNKIADRVQYKRIEGEEDKWQICHVDA